VEFVTVAHPDIEGTAEVSRDAYDVVYAEKGWQIVDEDTSLTDGVTVVPGRPPVPTAPPVEPAPPSDTPIGDSIATSPAQEV
jgi:hypothetical protein